MITTHCTASTIIVLVRTEKEQNTKNVFGRLPKNGDCWLYNYYKKWTLPKKGNFRHHEQYKYCMLGTLKFLDHREKKLESRNGIIIVFHTL